MFPVFPFRQRHKHQMSGEQEQEQEHKQEQEQEQTPQKQLVYVVRKEVQLDYRGDTEWQFGVYLPDKINMTLWWDDISTRKQWIVTHGVSHYSPDSRLQSKQVYMDGADHAMLTEHALELMKVQNRLRSLGVSIGQIAYPRVLEVKSAFEN